MYHIAICDDSREYISYIKGMLQEIKKEENIDFKIYEFMSGEEFVFHLDGDTSYDLLILDMQLGKMDGDETAQIFRKKFPYAVLVFCSGVRQPTIQSFKATPFRYLLKSQSRQELMETMKEVFEEVKKKSMEPSIIAHYRWTIQRVKIKNILYIENAKRGGRIVVCPQCKEIEYGEKILVDKKPGQLLAELEPYGFALAHSTCLVNMNHIQLLHTEDFVFDSGEIMKIARTYQKSFREAFVKRFTNKYI